MKLTIRHKLFAAVGLLALLPAMASSASLSAATGARALLAIAALGGLAIALTRARGGELAKGRFKDASRLQVVQRLGLSQRSAVALVEVDGRAYLIVHGDGFARIRATRRPRSVAPEVCARPSSAQSAGLVVQS